MSPKKTASVKKVKAPSNATSAKKTARAGTAKAATNAKKATGAAEMPVLAFATTKAWQRWLDTNHAKSDGLWLQIAKKGSGMQSITHDEAVEVALCFGWIDGQAKSFDPRSWVQKFTPRRTRSMWSKINRDRAEALIESGAMKPAGLAEIARAKQDGRWAAAYESPRNAEVPGDLQSALDRNREAAAFFATLSSQNRYAILFRIHHAKKAETRARRIEQFIAMLERHETLHPQRSDSASK
jgi:uncharacterized protein YdeI (YjbR/CyaY-like superfamily)